MQNVKCGLLILGNFNPSIFWCCYYDHPRKQNELQEAFSHCLDDNLNGTLLIIVGQSSISAALVVVSHGFHLLV